MAEWSKKLSSDKKVLITKMVMALIGVTNMVLTVVWLSHLSAWIFYCSLCIFAAVFVASLMLNNAASPIYKLLILFNVIAFLSLISYIVLYQTGVLERIKNIEELRSFIGKAGGWGIMVFFMLTLLQVVILPIPAAVTILLGVIIYGPTVSFIVSTLGTIAGSVICFLLGKFFGYKVVAWIIGEDKADKYTKLISEKGKIPFIVMMLFPFFPDDILCMAAGLTKMTFKFFIISVSLARPVMIAFFSYFGTGEIIPFKGWGIPIWIAIFVFTLFVIYLVNYLLKRKNKSKNNDNNKDE